MFSRTLGVVATAAVGAGAFLVPAGINIESDPLFTTGLNPKSQIVRMPCPSCVFSSESRKPIIFNDDKEDTFLAQGSAIDVVFNVTIDSNNQLLFNGEVCRAMGGPKHVMQVPASTSTEDIVNRREKSEILEVTGAGSFSNSRPNDVLKIYRYSIDSLDMHPVQLDDFELDLLTFDDGELMIHDLRIVPSRSRFQDLFSDLEFNDAKKQHHDAHPSAPSAAPSSDCAHAGLFHKIFCEVKSNISKFRASHFGGGGKKPGCKGGFRGAPKPTVVYNENGIVITTVPGHLKHPGGSPPPPPQHGAHILPHHGRPHHHHHHPKPSGPSTAETIASVLLMLAVWTASFFVGYFSSRMILFVVACVRKVFFGVPFPNKKEVGAVKDQEEGRALMAEEKDEDYAEEALPVYEDAAPAYEEKVAEEEEEKVEQE